MIFVQTMKMLVDLNFFYAFAAAVGFRYGTEGLLVCGLLQSICYGLSSKYSETKGWRILALFPMVICWIICQHTWTNMLAMLSSTGYIFYLVYNGDYTLSVSRQRQIFKVFVTIAALFFGIMAVGGASERVLAAMPFAFIAAAVSILLMRSLRHDRDVFTEKTFQLVNVLSVGGILLLTYAASTDWVLRGIGGMMKWIFQCFFLPVLTLLAELISYVVYFAVMLLSKAGIGRLADEQSENMSFESFSTGLDETILAEANQENGYIITIIAAILGAAVVICFFRWLAKSHRDKGGMADPMESQRSIVGTINRKKEKKMVGMRSIRGIYKKFLRLCMSKGMVIEDCDTSASIQDRAKNYLPMEKHISQIREIYIRHRYGEDGSDEAFHTMKKLYQELKKETKKK